MSIPTLFRHGKLSFHLDADNRVNLTALWREAGSPMNRDPRQFERYAGAAFIADLAQNLNVGKSHVWTAARGKFGGTFAHWQIALAYAQYLSPEFHRLTNEAFRQWTEEQANPDLKVERAYHGYRRHGLDAKESCDRIQSIAQRKQFTDELADAGVKGSGFAIATNRLYQGLYRTNANGIRKSRGLPPGTNLRNEFDSIELAAVRHSEALAGQGIRDTGVQGLDDCGELCELAGESVREASEAFKAKLARRGYGGDGASLKRRSG